MAKKKYFVLVNGQLLFKCILDQLTHRSRPTLKEAVQYAGIFLKEICLAQKLDEL